jgi:hypothetical protein
MGFSVEAKCHAQKAVRQATPLLPLDIFYLHAPPPVTGDASFIQVLTPALESVCQELAPQTLPGPILAGFLNYITPRWSLFSSSKYEGRKSTYPVWVLHMLTYFINVNPGLMERNPRPVTAPDCYGPREGDSPEVAAWRKRSRAREEDASLLTNEIKLSGDGVDLGPMGPDPEPGPFISEEVELSL